MLKVDSESLSISGCLKKLACHATNFTCSRLEKCRYRNVAPFIECALCGQMMHDNIP